MDSFPFFPPISHFSHRFYVLNPRNGQAVPIKVVSNHTCMNVAFISKSVFKVCFVLPFSPEVLAHVELFLGAALMARFLSECTQWSYVQLTK